MTGTEGTPIPESAHPHPVIEENERHGRLTARPSASVAVAGEPGTYRVDGQALLRVPPAAEKPGGGGPYWLLVALHGAGGSAERALDWLLPQAGSDALLLLAPQASDSTWDVIRGGYGPDVARLDAALRDVFRRFPVRPSGVVVAGFSDGASYALSLGLANGDLFRTVLAFSPGFMAPMVRHGSPRIFVAHGRDDQVLPITRCSRRIVPELERAGYDVTYREFDGGHEVPPELATRALRWWVHGSPED
ncbi:alpha/beta hydrolase [Streptomyces macrosporus]|uniref:Serine esterase n=1 Tax=Streptomyces macrosporus TaxID=44032 RepID=A0ABN3K1S5_9ACTN